MARYLVKWKQNSVSSTSYSSRILNLRYGTESEAKEELCRQSAAYRDAVILSVEPE